MPCCSLDVPGCHYDATFACWPRPGPGGFRPVLRPRRRGLDRRLVQGRIPPFHPVRRDRPGHPAGRDQPGTGSLRHRRHLLQEGGGPPAGRAGADARDVRRADGLPPGHGGPGPVARRQHRFDGADHQPGRSRPAQHRRGGDPPVDCQGLPPGAALVPRGLRRLRPARGLPRGRRRPDGLLRAALGRQGAAGPAGQAGQHQLGRIRRRRGAQLVQAHRPDD